MYLHYPNPYVGANLWHISTTGFPIISVHPLIANNDSESIKCFMIARKYDGRSSFVCYSMYQYQIDDFFSSYSFQSLCSLSSKRVRKED
jgi:hypothetical protein